MQSPAYQPRDAGNHRIEISTNTDGGQLAIYDFTVGQLYSPKIVILKLDHLGDFLIGLPALMRVRDMFPKSQITLICGPWNVPTARALGVIDEIRSFEFFPENAKGWGGDPVEDVDRFREVCEGRFDIALDLRVDEDTRPLLRHVDAALRCGIGARSRHPYLNVALPAQFETRERRQFDDDTRVFPPGAFHSRMPIRTPFFHETDFSVTDAHLIYGPYSRLPLGEIRAQFAFQISGPALSLRKIELVAEVVREGASDAIAFKRIKLTSGCGLTFVELSFYNGDPIARYEFRVFVGGRLRRPASLRFFGVRIERIKEELQGARFLPAELHVGEQLSLLVALVGERVRPLYEADLPRRLATPCQVSTLKAPRSCPSAKCIVIAPFSNSSVRDWPLERYKQLIGLLLNDGGIFIFLVGTRGQTAQLTSLCRTYGDTDRVMSLAGKTDWSGLAALLRQADLVIANNSGVAHLAAACGRPTLAIYSGSHQPQEWGPRGRTIRTITAVVSCSPCGYEDLQLCPHDHRCMTMIEPETVAIHARAMMGKAPELEISAGSSAGDRKL
jgi:ADP-heptose:LPS heptosyltransferase